MTDCGCPPCPGNGGDYINHCAECCFGTFVEAEIDCPTHGDPDLFTRPEAAASTPATHPAKDSHDAAFTARSTCVAASTD